MRKTVNEVENISKYMSPGIMCFTFSQRSCIMAGSSVPSNDPEGYEIDSSEFGW